MGFRNQLSTFSCLSQRSIRISRTQGIAYSFILLLILAALIQSIFHSLVIPSSRARADANVSHPALGINLTGLADYSGDFLFADAMKEARDWGSVDAPWDGTALVDGDGWPTGDAGIVVVTPASSAVNIHGTYSLSFTGQATVHGVASDVIIQNQRYDDASNTTTANLVVGANNNNSQLILAFQQTKRSPQDAPGTGVTNVKVMLPQSFGSSASYLPSTTFTQAAKTLINKFQAIRFMDFARTNGNEQINWADRRLPTYATQAGTAHSRGGGAWEYAIQLCNETEKDAYINIPELATNDYVSQLAKIFRYGSDANGNVYNGPQSNPVHAPLNPNLHLYVEYSNEVWNSSAGFTQFSQNIAAVKADIANNTAELQVLNFDHLYPGGGPDQSGAYPNQWDLAWRRQALRIKETSDIFRSIFGDSAMMSQVRPLLEWQYGGSGIGTIGLSFLNTYFNNADGQQHVSQPHPVNYFLWGGGGAAYSGVQKQNASTIDEIYASGLDTGVVGGTVVADVTLAKGYGLHNVAYEGGFNIGGDNASALQKQANQDARAKQMEIDTQNVFNQSGGELLMYFCSTGYTAYGMATPTVFNLDAPKVQAIDALNQATQAAPTVGTLLSSMIGTSTTIAESMDGNTAFLSPSIAPVQMRLLRASQTTTYHITFYGTQDDVRGKEAIVVDGQAIGTFTLPFYADGAASSTPALTFTLEPGLHSLFLYVNGPGRISFPANGMITITAVSGSSAPSSPTVSQTQPAASDWTFCANEGATCAFSGTQVVRYGVNGQYAYRTTTGSIACNNTTFGDPIAGTAKTCVTSGVPPSGWTTCAGENGTCSLPAIGTVAYGANGQYAYRTATGSIGCNNTTFGDPIIGTYKSCFFKARTWETALFLTPKNAFPYLRKRGHNA